MKPNSHAEMYFWHKHGYDPNRIDSAGRCPKCVSGFRRVEHDFVAPKYARTMVAVSPSPFYTGCYLDPYLIRFTHVQGKVVDGRCKFLFCPECNEIVPAPGYEVQSQQDWFNNTTMSLKKLEGSPDRFFYIV